MGQQFNLNLNGQACWFGSFTLFLPLHMRKNCYGNEIEAWTEEIGKNIIQLRGLRDCLLF